ncbi:hypothetical protein LB506_009942 [Fusarium annulatum]|nr:hypothetical protein LB506_009942 [Fusarium annulatum]
MTLSLIDLDDPQWIHVPELRTPRFDGDPRCHRDIFPYLEQVFSLGSSHKSYQWGFVIIRTAYGPQSDEQSQHVLTLIGRIAQAWPDHEISSSRLMQGYAKEKRQSSFVISLLKLTQDQMTSLHADIRMILYKFSSSLMALQSLRCADAESGYDEAFCALPCWKYDLAEYTFHRRSSRRLVVHRNNRENPGVLYYGIAPWELTPLEQAIEDMFKANMKKWARIGKRSSKELIRS